MSNSKISALTSATTPLAGTEPLPIVQSGATTKVTVANLTAGRAVSAASLALTSSPLPATSGGTGSSSAFTANGLVYANSTTTLTTGSALQFDGTNLGLGVAPNAWPSDTKAMELNTGTALSGYNAGGVAAYALWGNGVVSGGNAIYKITGRAFQQTWDSNAGAVKWNLAPSGTAGNAITFTQAMTLDASGRLSINTTATAGGCNLNVAGGINSTNGALNVQGNGGFYNGANKFGVDNNGGASRLYSSGANSSTRGSFEFHITDSVDETIEIIKKAPVSEWWRNIN